jgi:hypothetical protein
MLCLCRVEDTVEAFFFFSPIAIVVMERSVRKVVCQMARDLCELDGFLSLPYTNSYREKA